MKGRIFISYSLSQDQVGNLAAVAELLESRGDVVFVPDRAWQPSRIPKRIRDWLASAQFVLVIATDKSRNFEWVNQELGYALQLKKKVIVVSDSGRIQSSANKIGAAFVYLDHNPYKTLESLSEVMSKIKAETPRLGNLLIPAGLLVALFLLLSSGKEK